MPVVRLTALFLVLTAALPLSARSLAPKAGPPLAGVVQDSQRLAVAGATVVLVNHATGLERKTVTRSDGTFAFEDPGRGPFRVTCSARGFAPWTVEVASVGDPLAIALEPSRLEAAVVVQSASRQEELRESTAATVNVVQASQAVDPGGTSVAEALRIVPGVITRRGSEGTAPGGEQVQGIDSRQVLVLVDGQPVASARGIKSGMVNLDRYSLGPLDRIEVVKGAASAVYGSDAIGGVVNLITRDPRRGVESSILAVGGTLGLADFSGDLGVRQDRWSLLALGGRRQRDSFDLTPTSWDTTGAAFWRHNLFTKGTWRTAPVTFTASADGYRNRQESRVNGELGPQDSETTDNAWSIGGRADWTIDARTSAQFRLHTAGYHESADGRLAPPLDTVLDPGRLDERLVKADGTLARVLGDRQFVQTGVEVQHDDYSGINRLRSEDGQSATTATWWVQDKITFGSRTTVTGGLRVDHHDVFGTAVSPKAGVNVRLNDLVRARAAYGHGFRAPDLGQLYYRFLNPSNFYQVIGNPSLEPERSNSAQAGFEIAPRTGAARVGVSAYWNDVENLIEAVSLGFVSTPEQLRELMDAEGIDSSFQPVPGRLLFLYKNVARARTRGVEVDGELRVLPSLQVAGAYTYLQARDLERDLDLTGRSPHQGAVRVAWTPLPGFSANLQGTIISSWIAARSTTATGVTDTAADGFSLWDVALSQRIARRVTLTAAVLNLGDSVDPNTGALSPTGTPLPIYRPEYGRVFRAGVRFDLGTR